MVRDQRDEWPEGTAPGTFDIHPCQLADYPGVTARIFFVCPNRQRCGVFLGPNRVPRSSEDRHYIWAWDGNAERPSLQPSINCIAEEDGKPTGLCGWHGHITDGVMK